MIRHSISFIAFNIDHVIQEPIGLFEIMAGQEGGSKSSRGWLMTAVAPWGENGEDAFDQGLVELGLGDARLIQVQGAMLPLGFNIVPPEALPMGSLVECHLATAYAWSGSTACAGVGYALCETPEGEECAIVATITTEADYEETVLLLRRNIQRKLASRDLEVVSFDVAVDEVTAGPDHHGVAIAALILPDSLRMAGRGRTGPIRGALTRSAEPEKKRVDTKAPAAPALRPGGQSQKKGLDFRL